MQSISYTFPSSFPIADLRGVTATGGRPGQHRGEAVVIFNPIKGHVVIARMADKPELEAAVAAYKAKDLEEARADQDAREAAHPGLAEREVLAAAEYNTYSPEHFPGSARWHANHRAAKALADFDAAHPELVSFLQARKAARDKARYDGLSDFVKAGS